MHLGDNNGHHDQLTDSGEREGQQGNPRNPAFGQREHEGQPSNEYHASPCPFSGGTLTTCSVCVTMAVVLPAGGKGGGCFPPGRSFRMEPAKPVVSPRNAVKVC